MKNKLHNFSAYAKVYENRDGSTKGVVVSGYTNEANGKREYVNLWIPAVLVRIGKCKDGAPMLSIKMAEIAPPKCKNSNAEDANDDYGDIPF